MEILTNILTAVLVAVLPILAGFLCDMIHKAAVKFQQSAEDARIKVLIGEIDEAVRDAVIYVNQTFVDELKRAQVFGEDEEYPKQAFEEAYSTALKTISDSALEYIEKTFGDLREYLTVKIEKAVSEQKYGF